MEANPKFDGKLKRTKQPRILYYPYCTNKKAKCKYPDRHFLKLIRCVPPNL